ncbi:hypothetical protein GF358_03390 [Candidatus Woesearchaeota archaeon]|nr:hypothetical protein [Candidatus Woesearchaeota archaeon]
MGIFGRLFKKEQETEEHIIYIEKLQDWYDKQLRPKKKKLNQKIKQAKQKIIQHTQEMNQKLEDLNNAKLMNPNIPERAKHFLTGNREAYTKKLKSFLEELALPEEPEELEGFFTDFNVQIQTLAQSIARPTQILSEFLANETRAAAIPLGKIEKTIQQLKESMEKMNLNQIQKTKNKIQETQNKIQKQKELREESNKAVVQINTIKKENEQLKKEIDLLQKDKELNSLKQEKKDKKAQIDQMQKELLKSFSVIETALKKYEHITFKHKELVGKYLKSPIDALTNDLHLEIIHMLADLKKSAEAGKLEMKNRKTQKTIAEIKKITKDRLGKFLTEYGQLHVEEKKLQEKINKMEVITVAEAKEKKLEKNNTKLKHLMSKMNHLKNELNKFDIPEEKKEIEKELSRKFNINLTVSLIPLMNEANTQKTNTASK